MLTKFQKKTKMKKNLLILVALAVVVTGCADANTLTDIARDGAASPAGFWRGWWHGICAPFAFIGIMFGADIGIYEAFNTGNWYNFGLLLGLGGLGGSITVKYKR